MNSIYRVLTLTFLVCLSGCIRDHAVAVTNNTEDILYDVTYSDCYWSVLQPGETSEVCIPSFREDHIRFFLIDITEEEEDHFPDFRKHLDSEDVEHMAAVFERRKDEEKDEAEVTPEKQEDAKE